MKYIVLALLNLLILDAFSQNDRLVFKTYWEIPNSEITIPLLIKIDSLETEMIQLTTNKVETPIEVMALVRIDFNKIMLSKYILNATNVQLERIVSQYQNIIIDKFCKKDDFQLYIWNTIEEQLIKWFYVQPYHELPKSWKHELEDIPLITIWTKIQLIPTS